MAKKKKRKSIGTGGLHLVALFEGAKGVLVLVTGFGLLAYIHRDVHEAAAQLVRHLHLNPASHYPHVFLDLMERVHSTQLWAMAGAALVYAVVRIAEAVGLWFHQRWAEWFGVLTGGIYIPVEIYEVTRSVTWPRVTVLLVNVTIVAYLLLEMSRHGKK
ncbi:putative protein [Geobacter sp. OR-1]|uniref:DUF2127 domain-containing protein n=1 Tax=Geobacter sp. OR-1 TaxID=1266765 RepID=UPI000541A1D0|nr:DUF2127 domain-containing protein [Geobacter sp. OR-1]GAM09070.1 putative protein [Geobacter sp. OR-1]